MKHLSLKVSIMLVLTAGIFFACNNSKPVIKAENVDKSKMDKEITASIGDTVKIEMASNVTTGYKWEQACKIKPNVLEFVNSEYIENKHATGMVGVGGKEIWTYIAKEKGEIYLYFKYQKGEESGKEKYFQVIVQ